LSAFWSYIAKKHLRLSSEFFEPFTETLLNEMAKSRKHACHADAAPAKAHKRRRGGKKGKKGGRKARKGGRKSKK